MKQVGALTTLAMILAGAGVIVSAQQSSTEQPDKYTWLEDIYGERSMAWVKAEDARTAAVLEKNSHFAPLEAEALKVLESPDRLPDPEFRNGVIYNTWRDAEHVRGIVRRTTLQGLSDGKIRSGRRCSTTMRSPRPTSRVGWGKG